ncbi:uncharacterized protein BKA78DRAFT_303156 [Phyllosticta capitalensis]|uniref:uncharacterized protein n=1 Tax=Phyllosticta capitalensis TaxID=121624 RepID=UPI00312CDFC5
MNPGRTGGAVRKPQSRGPPPRDRRLRLIAPLVLQTGLEAMGYISTWPVHGLQGIVGGGMCGRQRVVGGCSEVGVCREAASASRSVKSVHPVCPPTRPSCPFPSTHTHAQPGSYLQTDDRRRWTCGVTDGQTFWFTQTGLTGLTDRWYQRGRIDGERGEIACGDEGLIFFCLLVCGVCRSASCMQSVCVPVFLLRSLKQVRKSVGKLKGKSGMRWRKEEKQGRGGSGRSGKFRESAESEREHGRVVMRGEEQERNANTDPIHHSAFHLWAFKIRFLLTCPRHYTHGPNTTNTSP